MEIRVAIFEDNFLGDYYTVNTFDQAGNVLTWDFYIGSILLIPAVTYSAIVSSLKTQLGYPCYRIWFPFFKRSGIY